MKNMISRILVRSIFSNRGAISALKKSLNNNNVAKV
jgi:hypothetical protein